MHRHAHSSWSQQYIETAKSEAASEKLFNRHVYHTDLWPKHLFISKPTIFVDQKLVASPFSSSSGDERITSANDAQSHRERWNAFTVFVSHIRWSNNELVKYLLSLPLSSVDKESFVYVCVFTHDDKDTTIHDDMMASQCIVRVFRLHDGRTKSNCEWRKEEEKKHKYKTGQSIGRWTWPRAHWWLDTVDGDQTFRSLIKSVFISCKRQIKYVRLWWTRAVYLFFATNERFTFYLVLGDTTLLMWRRHCFTVSILPKHIVSKRYRHIRIVLHVHPKLEGIWPITKLQNFQIVFFFVQNSFEMFLLLAAAINKNHFKWISLL